MTGLIIILLSLSLWIMLTLIAVRLTQLVKLILKQVYYLKKINHYYQQAEKYFKQERVQNNETSVKAYTICTDPRCVFITQHMVGDPFCTVKRRSS